jgi:hypothetical protein
MYTEFAFKIQAGRSALEPRTRSRVADRCEAELKMQYLGRLPPSAPRHSLVISPVFAALQVIPKKSRRAARFRSSVERFSSHSSIAPNGAGTTPLWPDSEPYVRCSGLYNAISWVCLPILCPPSRATAGALRSSELSRVSALRALAQQC